MCRSLSGRGKLDQTPGCWWWSREFAALLRSEALYADKWLEVVCGNLFVEAGDSLNVEAQRVLFLGLFQCATLRSPLDQEFFDGCVASVVFHSAGLCAG